MKVKILIIVCLSTIYTQLFSQIFYNATGIREIRMTFPTDEWDKFLDSTKRSNSDARLTGTVMIEGQKF